MTSMRVARSAAASAMAALIAAAPFLATTAQAQGRREFERERYHTPHMVYDDRFHHNHYYPSFGYGVSVLPPGYLSINFRGGRFFFHGGVWYAPGPAGYVVVRPPVGVVVPVLPPAYTPVWMGGVPYYYANDIYYVQAPGGYVVAAPPMEAGAQAQAQPQQPYPQPQQPMSPPPPGAGPQSQPASGTWYYCESAKGYYPYVPECKEGWRTVPAAPPR